MSRGPGKIEQHILREVNREVPELIPVYALAWQFAGARPAPALARSFRRAAGNLGRQDLVAEYEVMCMASLRAGSGPHGVRPASHRWMACVAPAGTEFTDDMIAGAQKIMIDVLVSEL